MKKCRPSKWVPWALVGVGLPLLAAWSFEAENLKNDVMMRATGAVTSNEATKWANLTFDGRDAVVGGTATSKDAVDAAVNAVRNAYGVRMVTTTAQIVEPPKLTAPTVESVSADRATPEIRGTWPHEVAKTLAVTVAGTTYTSGESPELTTDGPNWLLKLSQPLADGEYDVTAEVSDGARQSLGAVAPGKLTVKLPDIAGPALPTLVAPAAGATWPYALTGTFDEADTKKLAATVDGSDYVLGSTPELTSDGKGTFSFAPARTFAPGSYDVTYALTDSAGNVTSLKSEKAIVVPEPEAAPVAAPVAAEVTPLPPPVIITVSGGGSVTGTFDEPNTQSLMAIVDGRSYMLGRGAALTSDGKGTFTFAPSRRFAPGNYDVDFTLTNKAGAVTTFTAEKVIVVAGDASPPVPAAEAPPAPPAPTVTRVTAALATPTISGTWPKAEATGLKVLAGGVIYELGKDAALTDDGAGNWTLVPAAPLKDGIYDVVATATNAAGLSTKDVSVAETEVDTTGPAAPALDAPAEGAAWPYPLTGTINGRDTRSLTATVDGRTYQLGRGAALTAVGDKFTFAPARKFAPGSYNIDFVLNDALGNTTKFTAEKAIVVPEPPRVPTPPPAPTVVKQVDLTGTPKITGAWPKAEATGLAVAVNGSSFELGKDAALTSDDAGNWSLTSAATIADGVYDVTATATNADGLSTVDATAGELEVDAVPPARPTVVSFAGETSPAAVTGTWDNVGAETLNVSIPGLNLDAKLGASGSPLTADGGNWSLTLAAPATPGAYEVFARSSDRQGRTQDDETTAELVITAANAVASAAPAFDCVGLMQRISQVFPMRFNYDTTDFASQFGLSVNQYAALLSDKRCAALHVEVSGHADERGDVGYNMDLSARRAETVLKMLVAAGVDGSRLSSRGYGETVALQSGNSEESYALNRRVELRITKQ